MSDGIEALAEMFAERDNPIKALGRIQIGEVVSFSSNPKKITLNIAGLKITKNISIAQHLLKGYNREFKIGGNIDSIQLDLEKNEVLGVTSHPVIPYKNNPTPPPPWSIKGATGSNLKGSGTYTTHGTITWTVDSLKAGDMVKVLISHDEKRFFITDRFSEWEE